MWAPVGGELGPGLGPTLAARRCGQVAVSVHTPGRAGLQLSLLACSGQSEHVVPPGVAGTRLPHTRCPDPRGTRPPPPWNGLAGPQGRGAWQRLTVMSPQESGTQLRLDVEGPL